MSTNKNASESQAAGEPTKEELAFVRRMQHFYCDNIVDGCPTGDWHIESTPAQAVSILRTLLAAEKLADQVKLSAAQARINMLDKELTYEHGRHHLTHERAAKAEARIASLTGELDACEQHVKIKQERIAELLRELSDNATIEIEHSQDFEAVTNDLKQRVAVLEKALEAAKRDSDRLHWLHQGGAKDLEGFEWGVFRVKWSKHGKPEEVWQTFSDFSDLDAEMTRERAAQPSRTEETK